MGTIFSWLITTGFLFILKHFGFMSLPGVLLGVTNPVGILLIAGGIFFMLQYLAGVLYGWFSIFLIGITSLRGQDAQARAIAQAIFFPVYQLIALPTILLLMTSFGVITVVWTGWCIAIVAAYWLVQAIAYAASLLLTFIVNS